MSEGNPAVLTRVSRLAWLSRGICGIGLASDLPSWTKRVSSWVLILSGIGHGGYGGEGLVWTLLALCL